MQNKECATFHLNSNDIFSSNTVADYTGGVINANGTINSIRTDFTFNNIDFKTILGTMYEKYDRFNMKLSCVISGAQIGFGSGNVDRCLKINISGLPLCNSGYHQLMGNTGYTTVGSAIFVQTTCACTYFNDDNVFSIYKPMPMCNIRIYLQTIQDITPSANGAIYPTMDFYFRIYGIEK